MTVHPTEDRELQAQIESTTARVYSTDDIEERIAYSLLSKGEFYEDIKAADLEAYVWTVDDPVLARNLFLPCRWFPRPLPGLFEQLGHWATSRPDRLPFAGPLLFYMLIGLGIFGG